MRRFSSLIAASAWLFVAAAPAGQSFDCRKASTRIEKMICADPELSRLDEEMARGFAEARKNLDASAAGQAAWLKDVRSRCGSVDCLKTVYRERVRGLNRIEGLAGAWTRFGDTTWTGATVNIENVGPAGFTFELSAMNGAHSGLIEGPAVRDASVAVYTDDESKCVVRFSRTGDRLLVALSNDCRGMGGMGVTFGGEFGKGDVAPRTLTLTELGLLAPNVTEQAFSALVGGAYDAFTTSFQIMHVQDGPDGARVATGSVRGLVTEIGAIVISRPDGVILAAVIDDDVVRYFSNDPAFKTKLHPAIDEWREPFADRKVVFESMK